MKKFLIKHSDKVIIFIFFLFVLIFTQGKITMTNPASRFLTMEAIVENHSFKINEKCPLVDDKIYRTGDCYSTKPPVLSVAGAGIYYVLYNYFGLDFPEKTNYYFNSNISVYIITLLLVGASYLALLIFMAKTADLLAIEKKYKNLLVIGFGLSTLYFTYSITLNNHTIAGSLLFISFYYLFKARIEKKYPIKYFLLSGLLASLSAVIDLPTGLAFVFLFFVYIFLFLPRKNIIYFLLPMIPIFALHLSLNLAITGDLLPAQFHPEFWNKKTIGEESIQVVQTLGNGGLAKTQSLFLYIFNITIGTHGLFFYSPILIFFVIASYKIIRAKDKNFFPEAMIILSGFMIIFLFYALKVRIYTGSAYGFRWFLAVTPLLYFLIFYLFKTNYFKNNINYFLLALAISFILALIGLTKPWAAQYTRIYVPMLKKEIKIEFPLLPNLNPILKN